jgi:hypothetical protein
MCLHLHTYNYNRHSPKVQSQKAIPQIRTRLPDLCMKRPPFIYCDRNRVVGILVLLYDDTISHHFPYRQTHEWVGKKLFCDVGIHRRLRRVVGLSVSTAFNENVALNVSLVVIANTFNASFREKLLSQLGQGNGLTAKWIRL